MSAYLLHGIDILLEAQDADDRSEGRPTMSPQQVMKGRMPYLCRTTSSSERLLTVIARRREPRHHWASRSRAIFTYCSSRSMPVTSRPDRTAATVAWCTPSCLPIQRLERPGVSRSWSAMI